MFYACCTCPCVCFPSIWAICFCGLSITYLVIWTFCKHHYHLLRNMFSYYSPDLFHGYLFLKFNDTIHMFYVEILQLPLFREFWIALLPHSRTYFAVFIYIYFFAYIFYIQDPNLIMKYLNQKQGRKKKPNFTSSEKVLLVRHHFLFTFVFWN